MSESLVRPSFGRLSHGHRQHRHISGQNEGNFSFRGLFIVMKLIWKRRFC
jgi:hypothetical protein